MRLRNILAVWLVVLSGFSAVQAQTYLGEHDKEPPSVIRPASTTMWRNYVTVPDGPCGCPMSVQADCYNPTCKPCGPLHPVCFSKRVVRMLDCVLPCNLCCGGGGHGLFGGCLGGKTWGNCSVCCGSGCGSCGGGCNSCGPSYASGCCPNPAGSVFDGVPCCGTPRCTSPSCTSCTSPSCTTPSCTSGGHCIGCSDAAAPPGLTDPFQDDPLPQPPVPRPTSTSPTEVRRAPTSRLKPVSTPTKEPVAAAPQASPYKIVSKPGTAAPAAKPAIMSKPAAHANSATTSSRRQIAQAPVEEIRVAAPAKPALRAASAESPVNEPAPHRINHARTAPISRSQAPEYTAGGAVPSNPLR